MKKRIYTLLANLALISMTFACVLPFGHQPPFSATPVPETTSLLPHSFYYLGRDSTGLLQVFRIEKDGRTMKQITFEPTAVGGYDVSLMDGSVAYVANNQLLLINADASGRRVLVDGGSINPDKPFENHISHPAFSPDGQTIAYAHNGLNLYHVATGSSRLVLGKPVIDPINGDMMLDASYRPVKYSPDGLKLLITISIPYTDAAHDAIYDLAANSIVRFSSADGSFFCCGEEHWTLDSLSFYAANPTVGMFSAGLWKVNATTGNVTTLIPGDAGGENFHLADEPYLAPDGQLYFFFANASNQDGMIERAPLQLVRAGPDGVTGRTVLRPDTFELMNESLWAPDASFVVVALATSQEVYGGGRAEIVYLDSRPTVRLTTFAQHMKWGP